MNRIITLNSITTDLYGYSSADVVLIKCDAANLAFSFTMPDSNRVRKVFFWVKKTDSTANVATINFIAGQDADGDTSIALGTQYDVIGLFPIINGYSVISKNIA